MSTLSPEDLEFECQRSRSLVQINSQNTNIDIERTDAECDKDMNDNDGNNDNDNDSNSSVSKKRNWSSQNTDFELSRNRRTALDVLRKKRRTSRDTRLPSPNNADSSNQMDSSNQPPAQMDLESEHIDVVFQEDSSHTNQSLMDNNHSVPHSEMDEPMENGAHVRDHRTKVREVFSRCYTGNTPKSRMFGPILAENSDEE